MNETSKKISFSILFLSISAVLVYAGRNAMAEDGLAARIKGHVVLQVEQHGEAWYVNPGDLKRYYLGRPSDAFDMMKRLSLGITDIDLAKIPAGFINDDNIDSDNDGLNDDLEKALGTDPQKNDTDGDGYDDKTELEKNYDPKSAGSLAIDQAFAKKHIGKIFLQVERNGGAWYVNPADLKRYYLNRPSDAFAIMRKLGLGITDSDLAKIIAGATIAQNAADTQPADAQGNKTYTDANANYTVEYPASWRVNTFSSVPDMVQITDAAQDYLKESKGVIAIFRLQSAEPIDDIGIFRVASKGSSKTLSDGMKTINDKEAYENSYEHRSAFEKTTTIRTGTSSREFVMVTLAAALAGKTSYEKIYDAVVASMRFGQQ